MSLAKLALCLATLGLAAASEEFMLDIPQGSLKGLKTTTAYQGKPMYSFKGIPYAKPNVGPNKFRLPESAEPWDGVLDATQHRSTCVFYCMIRRGIFGEEDCLFLNVYTPKVNKGAEMAVMVWFHPGGFNGGSGDDDVFGPDFLIEKDVVLVTMNYRLGAIGYLNTGDANAPGNAGMKDQVMALRWIRDNIESFGGSSNKVTIFGQGSGAASVQYHMMSPMSRGLFKSAIAQSGSTATSWAYAYKPRETAFMLGEMLGIKTTDSAELVNRLKELSAKELVDASTEMVKHVNRMNGQSHRFLPSWEVNAGQEIFLPADPWEMLKSGTIADVPFMSGINADEASFKPGLILGSPAMVDDNFDKFTPNDLMNVTGTAKQQAIGEAIKNFYFGGQSITTDPDQVIKLLSDVMVNYGATLTTKIINFRNSAPVYEYYFSHWAPFGFMKSLFKKEEGVAHGDELTYEFYSNAFKNKPMSGQASEKITNILTELWTNFAKESNPTPNMDGRVKVMWQPKGNDDNYMEINVEPIMKKSMIKERVSFWADIYKDLLGDYAKLFPSIPSVSHL